MFGNEKTESNSYQKKYLNKKSNPSTLVGYVNVIGFGSVSGHLDAPVTLAE